MTDRYLIPIELEADTNQDPRLIQELVKAVLEEGFSSYQVYGDLEEIDRLVIYISPAIFLDDGAIEERAKRTTRLARFWTKIEWRKAEEPTPSEQLGLPGLEASS